ncbi:reverse transcriptase [Tanacetum coccineum]|uniref:Reverse transcriptase n=1 Tax=Tanacetum coccineum TaxID=301880 RepID=A0ABQ5ITF2_9ASTR
MAPRNAPSQAWSPPSYREIKINGDAGVGNDGVTGLGFVIRSHSGAVLVAGSRCIKFATSVVEAEAKACLWAVEVALAKGFTRVVLESDSSVLVVAFKHDKVLVHIRALFLHIHRLCLSFESCSWSFVQREGNRVAHELARIALNDSIDGLYDGFVPPSVEPDAKSSSSEHRGQGFDLYSLAPCKAARGHLESTSLPLGRAVRVNLSTSHLLNYPMKDGIKYR